MNKRIVPSTFTFALLVTLLASAASAQVHRTFVSGLGNDGNPCSHTAPCRSFGQAISQTNPGGEVIVLDSAGYGPVTITKSVSLIASPGVYAGISVLSGDGIGINAGPLDTVILRGLTINNQGSNGNGIVFNGGLVLHIENCIVNGFAGTSSSSGLFFTGPAHLEVKDSYFRGNSWGIATVSGSGTAFAKIENVRAEGNGQVGILAEQGSRMTVSNSSASGNAVGFECFSGTSTDAELNIESCVAANNGEGIAANSGVGVATIRISASAVTNNGTGLITLGPSPVLLSRGNNTVEGNSSDINGTIGSYAAK